MELGEMSILNEPVKIGKNVKIGHFCIIGPDVTIGDNVTIKNYVELRSGTKIGNDCIIGSGVVSSGYNQIGDNCVIRYKCILPKELVIEDGVFLGPGVNMLYADHTGKPMGGIRIGHHAFIGSGAIILGGVQIGFHAVIGAGSVITRDVDQEDVVVGIPARSLL